MSRILKSWIAALLLMLLAGCALQAVAPPPDRFLVYFTEMSATLSPAARQIVADAAGRARATNTRSIRIEGRSSAIGSPAANQRLAEHRAEAVAAELAKDGLDRATFGQVWIGETGSGDTGVADRRVDIVLER